ncbi:MFS transporter [Corynebacterium sp. HS2168-gen11]|uniref:MFS transporter n=1 Tax=Corynebacterium sp. HS2168-gen11 TaxID=2974027 RepID=UPI00216B55D4|nr:MFS transporter [Corynebacterium sp. HS2168-gen11]MCS4535517.1 MHS family MFS transporter [Corynebacterium sp. HS2168-gen11]
MNHNRIAAATIIGTAIEWYDFFLYAAAAGLVFNHTFFATDDPTVATLLAFLSVGLSFLFRPLGAFLAGHFGDRIGRRAVLRITLMGMGIATTLIGLLPSFATIGIAAPLILIFLRIIQGVSAGGEWGGAVLMAVEHAPAGRRGLFGAFPQIGVPLGLLMSSGVLAIMALIAPGDAFIEWGWRIPFLLSFVLIFIGHFIRHGVDESPVFTEISERKRMTNNPLGKMLRHNWVVVLLAALIFAGNGAAGYMTTGGFIQNYATGTLGMERSYVLFAVSASAAFWLVFTLMAGIVSDYIGRRNTYILGFLMQMGGIWLLFPLVDSGRLFIALAILTIGLGFTYGQQSAFYAELFPASVRFSGVSVTYALGAILGGAFSPMIAAYLVKTTGSTQAVTYYLMTMALIGLVAALLFKNRNDIQLGIGAEQEQRESALHGL